jgi:hypothetical protein
VAKTPSRTVRLAEDLLRMAHVVCAHTQAEGGGRLRLYDLLDAVIRPELTRRHAEVLRTLVRQAADPTP